LKEIKKLKCNEFEKYRFIGLHDMKRELKNSLSKISSLNYVNKNMINDIKILEKFEEKIINLNNIVIGILDKIEYKIIQMLKFCEDAKDFIINDNNIYKEELEKIIVNAFRLLSIINN